MGGVDFLDRLLGSYRLIFHSKKGYWNLFSNPLNMVVVTGWILHSELHHNTTSDLSHLNFPRELILSLLQMKLKTQSIPGVHAHPIQSARQSNMHYLSSSFQGQYVVCQKITRKMYFKCQKMTVWTLLSLLSWAMMQTIK